LLAQTTGGAGPCTVYTFTTGTDTIVLGDTDTGNHGDDVDTLIALPFTFQLYNQTFTSVNVSSNGRLDFVTANEGGAGVTACLPAPPNNVGPYDYTIFALWQDMRTDFGLSGCSNFPGGNCGIFTSVAGSAPNRIFTIEWRTVLFVDNNATQNFEVRLYEGDPNLRFDVVIGMLNSVSADHNYVSGVQLYSGAGFFTQDFCTATPPSSVSRTYTFEACPFFVPLLAITAITRAANGHIVLHGVGFANATYSVQASPNLSPNNFVTIGTTSGGWQYEDAAAVGLTKRFYRVLPVPYSVNLIVDGNAELGPGSSMGQRVLLVPGWVATGPFTVVPYTAGGGFPTASDPGPPDRSNQFFAGGNGAVSTASQDIDISGNAPDINPGKVTCDLSAWLGGFFTDEDNATLTLTFFNGANNLGSFSLGPVTPAQRANQTGFLLRSLAGLQVPPNTTRLHVVLTMTRATGTFNDAYADSLSLVLHVQ
jgi:hypothetical protein